MFHNRKSGSFRIAILFLALFAMLGLSMASTSAQHMHLRSSSSSQCDICVTAHVVSLEAQSVDCTVSAAEAFENPPIAATVDGYQLLLVRSASSRGPPSLV